MPMHVTKEEKRDLTNADNIVRDHVQLPEVTLKPLIKSKKAEKEYLDVASQFMLEKKYQEAANNFHNAFEQNPEKQEALFGETMAQIKMNNLTQAKQLVEIANEKFPASNLTLLSIANVDIKEGNYLKARNELENVLKTEEQEKSKILAKALLAKVYLNLNENNNAQKLYLELETTEKNNPNIYFGLAITSVRLKDKASAIKYIDTAIKLDPKNKLYLTTKQKIQNLTEKTEN